MAQDGNPKKKKDINVVYQEIRLSVPKMNSQYDAHKVLYVTHEVAASPDNILHVSFEGIHYIPQTDWKGELIEPQLCFDQTQKFDFLSKKIIQQPDRATSSHIPYDIYNNNYLKLIEEFPEISKQDFKICQCHPK